MLKRARIGPSPQFKIRFQALALELQEMILDFATKEFRVLMANRIRSAFRLFKRRAGWLSLYVPSEQARALGDPGQRIVRVITLS